MNSTPTSADIAFVAAIIPRDFSHDAFRNIFAAMVSIIKPPRMMYQV